MCNDMIRISKELVTVKYSPNFPIPTYLYCELVFDVTGKDRSAEFKVRSRVFKLKMSPKYSTVSIFEH